MSGFLGSRGKNPVRRFSLDLKVILFFICNQVCFKNTKFNIMKRWIIYLMVLVGAHIYFAVSIKSNLKDIAKKVWNMEGIENPSSYYAPNWASPKDGDIFITKDTLGVIRYYKIVEGLNKGNLSLRAGKYNFSAGLAESISTEKWNFDFMNNSELYADSILQFSLDKFLALKEHVYLTRGFGMEPGKQILPPNYPYHLNYVHYLVLGISLAIFICFWFAGFLNKYLLLLFRYSEIILLGMMTIIATYFLLLDYAAVLDDHSFRLFFYAKGLVYAMALLYTIKFLNKKLVGWSFADQEAMKFLLLVGGGVILSLLGGYFQFLVVKFSEIRIFDPNMTIGNEWKFYAIPFHPPLWLAAGTGYFLNNFRVHFFQLRRKANAFKYARAQELEFKSELETLQAKINPHFLYNSLNSIASLAQSDPEKTESMALALSKFYKEKTNRKERIWSTVSEELAMLKTYLSIEKIRFGDRLEITVQCDETIKNEKLPRFLLQPLIENAIKYGYHSTGNKIIVTIKVEQQKGNLFFRILDSGLPFSDELDTGYGIRSVQKKLKLFYPDRHQMEFINHPEKQVFIQIKL